MSAHVCGCDPEEHDHHCENYPNCVWGRLPSLAPASAFVVKDSGARQVFESGMVRDTSANKIDYTRALDGPMFERLAAHLTLACAKYPDVGGRPNWMRASGDAELDRFKRSATRHFIQWLRGDADEDHAAAVFFNVNGAEYVKGRKP